MQNCLLPFRSEIFETVGGTQQMCSQLFVATWKNLLIYQLFFRNSWRCSKSQMACFLQLFLATLLPAAPKAGSETTLLLYLFSFSDKRFFYRSTKQGPNPLGLTVFKCHRSSRICMLTKSFGTSWTKNRHFSCCGHSFQLCVSNSWIPRQIVPVLPCAAVFANLCSLLLLWLEECLSLICMFLG